MDYGDNCVGCEFGRDPQCSAQVGKVVLVRVLEMFHILVAAPGIGENQRFSGQMTGGRDLNLALLFPFIWRLSFPGG